MEIQLRNEQLSILKEMLISALNEENNNIQFVGLCFKSTPYASHHAKEIIQRITEKINVYKAIFNEEPPIDFNAIESRVEIEDFR